MGLVIGASARPRGLIASRAEASAFGRLSHSELRLGENRDRTIEYADGAECPLTGVGGWSLVEEHPDRVYTIEDVQAALEPPQAIVEPTKAQDAWVYGDIDPALLAREIELGMSPAGSKTMPGRWKSWKTTVHGLLAVLTRHTPGEKDGNCFLQGGVIDGERRSNAIPHLDLLVLDLDTGENLEEIRARVQELGLFAVIYTTHSHLKPITSIKKDAVVKWLGGEENPDVDQVVSYLTEVKRYRPYILEGAELMELKHTSDGVQMFIKHKPMPKFRVVFLLKERFTIMERKGTQAQVVQEWKERYAGASKLLGAYFDRACTDPSRLFYTPRHPKDAKEWRIEVIAGKPLDIETVERVTQEELRKGAQNAFSQAAGEMAGNNKQYKTSSLLWFFGKYGDRFDIETFLLEMDPDGDRGSRNSGAGRTHRCPNDDAHSDAGNENDKAFFCVNATESETGQATAMCRHDSCSQLDRVDFTDLICERVGITDATELKRWVPETVEDEEEEKAAESEEGEQTPDYRAYKNVGEAKRAINAIEKGDTDAAAEIARNVGMSGFTATEVETLRNMLSQRSGVTKPTLDKEIKAGKAKADEAGGDDAYDDEVRAELARWNKRHAIVTMGAKVRVLIEPEPGESPVFMERDSFAYKMRKHKVPVVDAAGNRKMKQTHDVWVEWPEGREYDKVVFEPSGCPANHYNLWKGLPVAGRKGDWSLLRGHVLDNICMGNVANFNWFMTWQAQMFQHPGKKQGSAVVIIGKKGVGKSFLFDWLRKALKNHALKVSDRDALTNGFNGHQFGLLLMVLEEAFWAGDTAAQGKVKDAITSDEMLVTLKGLDSVPVSSYLRFVFISNEDWVVPADLEGERQFFVLQCGDGRRQDVDYFAAVQEQMDNGGLEAMVDELLHWDPAAVGLTWNSLRKPPITPWLTGQGEESMPIWDKFFYQLAEEGRCSEGSYTEEGVHPIELYDDEVNRIPRSDLRWFYNQFLKSTPKGRTKIGDGKLFHALAQDWLLADPVLVQTVNPNGQFSVDPKPRCFRLPSLNAIRASITTRKGLTFSVSVQEDDKAVLGPPTGS